MSEFKFACPVCGQHITSDASASGTHLECPTCFQKIVVPQAPSTADAKFILSASQVSKPRPNSTATTETPSSETTSSRAALLPIAGLVLLLGAAGAGAFVFRGKLFKSADAQSSMPTNAMAKKSSEPKKVYAVPTNLVWTLELTNVTVPEGPAVGSIHGSGFSSERATLQGGVLTLRQGKGSPPDLGISIHFFAQQGEELSGKTVEIAPDRQPPLPKVVMRWKGDDDKGVNKTYNGGYAMRVEFGDVVNARIPGRIYIALPDEAKSFVGGNFEAEIRKATPPKPKQPKAKQPKPSA